MKAVSHLCLLLLLCAAGLMQGCERKTAETRPLPPVGSALQSLSACLQIYVARNSGELPEKLTDLSKIADELHVSGVVEFPKKQLDHNDWIYWGVPRKLSERPSKDLLVAVPFPLYLGSDGSVTGHPESSKSPAFHYCINVGWEVVRVTEDDFIRAKGAAGKTK